MLQLSQRPLTGSDADAALFVDREQELDKLQRAAELRFNALLLGDRGSGRSSLLRQLHRRLEAKGIKCVTLDASSATDVSELTAEVAHHVRTRLARQSDVELGERPIVRSAAAPLRDLANYLGDGVVMLDDLNDPVVAHELFGRLRDDLWELPIRWIASGLASRRSRYLRPPADGFFDVTIELEEMTELASIELLRRRLGTNGGGATREVKRLGQVVPRLVARTERRTPRALLAAARMALLADEGPEDVDVAALLQAKAASLGRPAAMLFSELEAMGPISASDPELQRRLGWTRPRISQVLKQLEEAKVVVGREERAGNGPGRARKVYSLNLEATQL